MYLHEAIKKAQEENREIALPTNDHCQDGGYHLRAKPFPNNLVVLEFYGEVRKIDQFPLAPKDMVSDEWIVIN